MKEVLHLRIEQGDERMRRIFHAMTEAYNIVRILTIRHDKEDPKEVKKDLK